MPTPQLLYGGHCSQCQTLHTLPSQAAIQIAQSLMITLEKNQTIVEGNPRFSTDLLFGAARGQMFGVMLAQDANGATRILKAFSGQFNGHYRAKGWVPPIFNVDQFHRLNTPEERKIKTISRKIDQTSDQPLLQNLKDERRNRSRALMKKIHALYHLRNFQGETRPMADFFPKGKGMPTGTGDCCGPKLIHYANHHNLIPLAMAEFYFGRENRSRTREHGHFYPSCQSGCAPILGFMLCGLNTRM